MSKEVKKKSQKIVKLLAQLSSKDEKEQIKAVIKLKSDGDESVVEDLVNTFNSTESESLKKEIVDLFNTIKSTKVPAELVKCLVNPNYKASRQMMLTSIWSSGLDYNQYMGEIAQAAVEGELMEAIECITILENLENGLNEDEIMDALIVIKAYLVDNNDDSSKSNILKEIVGMLQQMNDSV
jgi:hypothetical protein